EAASAQGSRLPYWTTAEADALVATPSDGLEGAYLLREARLTVSAAITRRASGESVSDNYFELLGVHAARGRTFRSGERQHRPVVLSHVGWQRLLGEDPEPIGRSIALAGEDFTVIGVMPPQF